MSPSSTVGWVERSETHPPNRRVAGFRPDAIGAGRMGFALALPILRLESSRLACAALLLIPALAGAAYPPLQPLVDAAEAGSVLMPEPGIYAGPVRVDKPLTIDGRDEVTIDGGGKGTVVLLETDGATLRNLHLTNSGSSHNDLDSGVQVRGKFNVITDSRIDNALFGVDLQQSENNIVRRNHISSKPVDLGVRGDAIRLWYSFDNQVTDNIIRDARDTVVWYSRNNLIARNDARGGRYSLHFMYSQTNRVEGNHYENNTVGIFLMYSDGIVVRNNLIANATGTTGIGIGFKETSDVVIEGNRILYCAEGLYLDVSPYQPGSLNYFRDNLIAYNGIGIRFINDWQGNVLTGNRFKGNTTQVVVEGGKTANRNTWDGNYWDDYEGFDRDDDGVGDSPHVIQAFADRLWMDVPPAQFFKGSPMLEVIDFLERLAPFTTPDLLVRDEHPLWAADTEVVLAVPQAGLAGGSDWELDPDAESEAPAPDAAPGGYDAYEALRRSLGRD
ncbi:parallel beta-helix repeat protein [Thiocapsa marina 5811]|uniref:Parallel beta-helix repeat protein n=2 Tax=Thiocapsa marina TaxID=244573 RepID=F9U854_9GAMM|nr:parallel beta-helix repeat protein [Thiocapsa marina 5811]